MSDVQLILGDCLEVMRGMPADSVDAIITDLPYGTTACSWDEVIPFAPMWEQVKRVLKPRGVFVTTASQPFTSKLVMSNLGWFRYEWIWEKNRVTGHLDVDKRPLKSHENILLFAEMAGTTFNPQMTRGIRHSRGQLKKYATIAQTNVYGKMLERDKTYSEEYFPRSIVGVSADSDLYVTFAQRPNKIERHPTQKPVSLYEYLILTYTNPGETVLDICAGSGTTGEAAHKTGRNAILIEKDPAYYAIAQRRIAQAQMQPQLFGG